jgi:hypothetical protein
MELSSILHFDFTAFCSLVFFFSDVYSKVSQVQRRRIKKRSIDQQLDPLRTFWKVHTTTFGTSHAQVFQHLLHSFFLVVMFAKQIQASAANPQPG